MLLTKVPCKYIRLMRAIRPKALACQSHHITAIILFLFIANCFLIIISPDVNSEVETSQSSRFESKKSHALFLATYHNVDKFTFKPMEKVYYNYDGYPIIRPLDGFYETSDVRIRRRHAAVAKSFGIDGFIYSYEIGRPNVFLEAILNDGQPDIPFAVVLLHSVNVGNVSIDPLWLTTLLSHEKYVRLDNSFPLVFIDTTLHDHRSTLEVLVQRAALRAGFPGAKTQWVGQGDNIFSHLQNIASGVLNLKPSSASEASTFGMFAAVRTSVITDYSTLPSHPAILRRILSDVSKRYAIVVISSWNDWQTGSAIEPSVEYGNSWLRAIKLSKHSPFSTFVKRQGLRTARSGDDHVCIAVRTYEKHDDGVLFPLRTMLQTISEFEFTSWGAYIFDTGQFRFKALNLIVESFNDTRMRVVSTPEIFRKPYSVSQSAYDLTDYIVSTYCTSDASFNWFLVTNGDNMYAPDALNALESHHDIVLMNFYGRYTLVNSIVNTFSSMTRCCSRLETYSCTVASERGGFVDLGGMIFRISSWKAARLSFDIFTGACTESCHDGALIEYISSKLSWSHGYHPASSCALLHNPNPVSCDLVGGVYFDSKTSYQEAGCYTMDTLPLVLNAIDWNKFTTMRSCCVCPSKSKG